MDTGSASEANKNQDPDQHQSDKMDPDPYQFANDKPKCMSMNLFEHFFSGLSLYLEAKIQIRIRIRVKSRIRISIASNKNQEPDQNLDQYQQHPDSHRSGKADQIRIRIKVMRIRNTVTAEPDTLNYLSTPVRIWH